MNTAAQSGFMQLSCRGTAAIVGRIHLGNLRGMLASWQALQPQPHKPAPMPFTLE